MDDSEFDELSQLLHSARAGDRLRCMDRITAKAGGRIVRRMDDPRVVQLLIAGLGDPSLRVRRAAARGLRSWVADSPGLLDEVLPPTRATVSTARTRTPACTTRATARSGSRSSPR